MRKKADNLSHNTDSRRRELLGYAAAASVSLLLPSVVMAQRALPDFKRVPIQYIAALGDPQTSSGSNAQEWGLWVVDPGPRGVDLDDFDRLQANDGIAPARWSFDNEDWWLEEHGLIMEAPEFPLPAGYYQVTGDRDVEAILTVHPVNSEGSQRWELDSNASIYDVTHLRCRSGRYTPETADGLCSPRYAKQSDFPVTPGAPMPEVTGCDKQDYSVLIVTAIADYMV
jgi:hypothetical protein